MPSGEHIIHTESKERASLQGVVWDYDGLLVDTETIWFKSCQLLCAKFGIVFTEAHRLELRGGRLSQKLIDKFFLPLSFEEVRAELNAGFDTLSAEGLQMMPGALQLVQHLHTKWPMAIATNSNTHMASAGLKNLGIHPYFKEVIGGDKVEKTKPEPDIYLKAAKSIGVIPAGCLVFEDQPSGIIAAKRAGMFCIGVPNNHSINDDYSSADVLLGSLELATPDFIEELVQHPFFTGTTSHFIT